MLVKGSVPPLVRFLVGHDTVLPCNNEGERTILAELERRRDPLPTLFQSARTQIHQNKYYFIGNRVTFIPLYMIDILGLESEC